jgi:hypothetical protein
VTSAALRRLVPFLAGVASIVVRDVLGVGGRRRGDAPPA